MGTSFIYNHSKSCPENTIHGHIKFFRIQLLHHLEIITKGDGGVQRLIGKELIIKDYGYSYFEHCVESNKQPDGYYQLQAHTVMMLLGEYCYNGARQLPFELNVYFTDKDLEEVVDNEGQD
jgi:hypothetical protein